MSEAQKKELERGQVVEIIQSVIKKMEDSSPDHEIHSEIHDLSQLIDLLRQDIAQSQTGHLKHEDIPGATDELDAVVVSTADATHKIMSACEAMETLAAKPGNEDLLNHITTIYEACTFQDITGQRIKKVINTFRTIEDRIDGLLKTLDERMGPIKHAESKGDTRTGDAALLNGPQMPDKAIGQNDIDKLLSDLFD